jgi:hypothetical protein
MKHKTLSPLVAAAAVALPGAAFACGGLFCNNSQPVVQQAENILFVVEGETNAHARAHHLRRPAAGVRLALCPCPAASRRR